MLSRLVIGMAVMMMAVVMVMMVLLVVLVLRGRDGAKQNGVGNIWWWREGSGIDVRGCGERMIVSRQVVVI